MMASSETRSRVIACRGALATEKRLLGELRAVLEGDLDLTHPVRVIVPSRSLRRHLLCRIVKDCGALAGVVVQTAFSAAREVLERGGADAPAGDGFFDLVVRRLAAGEPALAENLEALEDGYGSVVGVVRDLLDAGFQPGHEEGVLDRLDDLERPVARQRVERARAIVRVAARCWEAMEVTGTWRSAHAFDRALPLVLEAPETVLPSSAILVHGFADVTGLVADFLEALSKGFPTKIVIDRPERPGSSGRDEPGLGFLDRFEARFSDLDREEDGDHEAAPEVVLTECADVESEARWVAERVRALLEAGVAHEDIGVVARHFEGVAFPLRRHLARLGVAFSGVGEGVAGGAPGRERARLVEVLRGGPATPVDLWLECRPSISGHGELQLALQQIGSVRLEDVASMRFDGKLGNGVRIHLALGKDGDDVVPAKLLRAAREEADDLVRAFEEWPEDASPPAHVACTIGILRALGWNPEMAAWQPIVSQVVSAAAELGVLESVERHEWLRLLADRLAGQCEEPIGGRGGGVQVLNVTEARAWTFTHLFVVGFNRGVFPRIAGDDSLLPDAIRSRLALDVLPEMPVRARSADEERYLFAQLFSAAPSVEVSWHLSAQGAVMSRSPFISDLLAADAPSPVAPPVWSSRRADFGARPAWEHAVLVAANGTRDAVPGPLEAAFESVVADSVALARARIDILGQVDPERLGDGADPWFGFVGPVYRSEENGAAVTRVEEVAECPWASFVTRRLRVAPMPDPQLGLPDPRGRFVGEVVHHVLEKIVRDAVGEIAVTELDEVAARPPASVPWPNRGRLDEMIEEAAHDVAEDAGLGPLGMATLLAARARPFLDVARRVEWGDGGLLDSVLATELSGSIRIGPEEHLLRFRADRVDRDEHGLRLVDYKTAKPVSTAKGDDTRRKHLLNQVAMGRKLQAAAYARVSDDGSATGRYLWLRPEIGGESEDCRNGVIRGDASDFAAALAGAVAAVSAVRDHGAVFPRVEEFGSDKKPEHCKYCDVAEICRRDDSGFRRRLVAWMELRGTGQTVVEEAARGLWHLGTGERDQS